MLNELLAAQHGVVTRAQAMDAGLTSSAIGRLLAAHRWASVHSGVYRHSAVPSSWEGDIIAAVLASGGVASHRSAARLHGIEGFGRWKPEVTVGRDVRRRIERVIVHHSTQFDRVDPVNRLGITCSGVDRTILDLGAVLRLPTLERAAESALRQRLTTWARLHQTLEHHSARGRNGCGVLRALLEYRYGEPVIPLSQWGRDVADRFRQAGLPRCVIEYRIHDEFGSLVLQVDLAFPDYRVAVELDSIQFHLGRREFERDRRARNQLRRLGWVVLEITWKEWDSRSPEVLRMVADTLHSRTGDVSSR